MGIALWIMYGLVVGVLAKLLFPGRSQGGFLPPILVGIAGALLGGYLGRALKLYSSVTPNHTAGGLVMSLIGAVVLLAIYQLAVGSRAQRTG
jgi:uncharacterized membrane protein YeaQ/YmgE (transglycosylase-associated protein family)